IDVAARAQLSQPAPPPPPPPIDEAALTQLSQLVDGDPRELAALLDAYLQTARQLIDQLTAAALTGDLAVVAQAAHSLKGNTGTFGALGLLQRCRDLEQALQKSEPAAIREAAAAVGSEYEAVSCALQQKCAALLQPPAPPA
ncbi:MAG TPA: Hpt domain-containing protein, partial [Pseudomonadota bacterium]|nr:Hpt domain-containing protein [Pseudomonadota bacterium]